MKCKPLLCLFIKEMINICIQQWALLIVEFSAKVKYCQGKNNIQADILSCIKSGDNEIALLEAKEEWITLEDLQQDNMALIPSAMHGLNDDQMHKDQCQAFTDERK